MIKLNAPAGHGEELALLVEKNSLKLITKNEPIGS